jgi:hypothetical protein
MMALSTWQDAADHGHPAEKPRWHLRPDLVPPPSDFRVVVDTREQAPLFSGEPWSVRGTLHTGDYSLLGHEGEVCLERKSLEDAYGTFGRGRERFERELERMRVYRTKAILIEGTYADVLDPERADRPGRLVAQVVRQLRGRSGCEGECQLLTEALRELGGGAPVEWRSLVRPASVEGSLWAWSHRYGVQVILAGSHRLAERAAFRWLAEWWIQRDEGAEL